MTFIGRHSIKINRAQTMAATGPYGRTFAAMLAAIPDTVIEALTARQLADTIDAMQRLAEASKAIAARDICAHGFAWDDRRGVSRDLAAA